MCIASVPAGRDGHRLHVIRIDGTDCGGAAVPLDAKHIEALAAMLPEQPAGPDRGLSGGIDGGMMPRGN